MRMTKGLFTQCRPRPYSETHILQPDHRWRLYIPLIVCCKPDAGPALSYHEGLQDCSLLNLALPTVTDATLLLHLLCRLSHLL